MSLIYYSMSGEGRGHATRVRAIVDELRGEHRFRLFAPGDAYDLLSPAYAGTDVEVERIPGLRFYYDDAGNLDFARTAARNLGYLWRFRSERVRMAERLRAEKPDLIITDFEPLLPRSARAAGIPFISLNHQHFLFVNDLSELPGNLRFHLRLMRLVVGSYYSGQARTIVSQFYRPPLRPGHEDAVCTGVIIRPALRAAARSFDGHLCVYLRRFAPPNVIAALREFGMPAHVYGLGERPRDGCVEFHAISEPNFIRHLATSEALVTTAGNQLVGEALFLGKPVLAMPEPGNHEQFINAFYLAKEGTGEWVELGALDAARLRDFAAKLPDYRARIVPERYDGNTLAVGTIREFMEKQ